MQRLDKRSKVSTIFKNQHIAFSGLFRDDSLHLNKNNFKHFVQKTYLEKVIDMTF